MIARASSAAVEKSEQRSECGVDRAEVVGNFTGTRERRFPGMAAHCHESPHGESDNIGRLEIPVRSGKTKPGDGGQDQGRVDGLQRVITKHAFLEVSWSAVFNDDIRAADETAKTLAALLRLQI